MTNHSFIFRCTVVLFNSKKLSQTYLLNTSRKAITAVAYSQCGRYLATGECGINPTIKVWELDQSPGNESNCGGSVIAEFSGHKYAVNCVVSLRPRTKFVPELGQQLFILSLSLDRLFHRPASIWFQWARNTTTLSTFSIGSRI